MVPKAISDDLHHVIARSGLTKFFHVLKQVLLELLKDSVHHAGFMALVVDRQKVRVGPVDEGSSWHQCQDQLVLSARLEELIYPSDELIWIHYVVY